MARGLQATEQQTTLHYTELRQGSYIYTQVLYYGVFHKLMGKAAWHGCVYMCTAYTISQMYFVGTLAIEFVQSLAHCVPGKKYQENQLTCRLDAA